jgi:uncharacterized protein (DUF362 family)
MNNFLRISSLFTDTSERNLVSLSKVYQDSTKLKMFIANLTHDVFTEDAICGKRILIKPNWVKQNVNLHDGICLHTHDYFIMAILEVLLPLKPAHVVVGDAPIQGCRWEKMILPEITIRINNLSQEYGVPVEVKDFRRTTFDPLKNNPSHERQPISEYVIFEMGKESYLESISNNKKILFRVTNYDPNRMAESHHPGVHKYCITKELFDADVIISLPKVKTHEKTGITAALKNIVGLNGDKDFLPHHRIGGTGFGGDCYPGKNYLRYFSELALDKANRLQGKAGYHYWTKLSSALWRLSFPGREHHLTAGWYGNDTTWRMVLDLNKIVIYGGKNGTLAATPQRHLLSLCDGIIGGQGDGPLTPAPLPLGIISFTNNSAVNDIAMAILMGFDYRKFPLLIEAEKLFSVDKCKIFMNGIQTNIFDLRKLSINAEPPQGWKTYLRQQ